MTECLLQKPKLDGYVIVLSPTFHAALRKRFSEQQKSPPETLHTYACVVDGWLYFPNLHVAFTDVENSYFFLKVYAAVRRQMISRDLVQMSRKEDRWKR